MPSGRRHASYLLTPHWRAAVGGSEGFSPSTGSTGLGGRPERPRHNARVSPIGGFFHDVYLLSVSHSPEVLSAPVRLHNAICITNVYRARHNSKMSSTGQAAGCGDDNFPALRGHQ